MSFIRKLLFVIGIILVLMIGVIFAVIWHHFIRASMFQGHQPMTVLVPAGTGIDHLTAELKRRNLLPHPDLFIFLARLNGDTKNLKAGEYEIKPGMTPGDLLANIVAGKVLMRSITLIEGRTFSDIREALNNSPYLLHETAELTDAQIMQQLGHADQHPEGLFFPSTYFFTWGDSDMMILKNSYAHMQRLLNDNWQQRGINLPYENAYQALIVASLVEKETALSQERAQISGVISRRLQKHMMLQVDPTVLYGLGLSHRTVITKANLATDTPYNTYRHYGLPPTPIDMPSRASIIAALHPDSSNALYYVARGDGSHEFSETYQAHRTAITKYIVKPEAVNILPASVKQFLSPCVVQIPLQRKKCH